MHEPTIKQVSYDLFAGHQYQTIIVSISTHATFNAQYNVIKQLKKLSTYLQIMGNLQTLPIPIVYPIIAKKNWHLLLQTPLSTWCSSIGPDKLLSIDPSCPFSPSMSFLCPLCPFSPSMSFLCPLTVNLPLSRNGVSSNLLSSLYISTMWYQLKLQVWTKQTKTIRQYFGLWMYDIVVRYLVPM